MLRHLIDDVKSTSGTALRLSALALACAVCLLITVGFICAAIFVTVLQQYGLPDACLSGAAVFLAATLITVVAYLVCRRNARKAALQDEKSGFAAAISDPAMIAMALQVARTIGFKRLIPLAAMAAIGLGLASGRRQETADPAE